MDGLKNNKEIVFLVLVKSLAVSRSHTSICTTSIDVIEGYVSGQVSQISENKNIYNNGRQILRDPRLVYMTS